MTDRDGQSVIGSLQSAHIAEYECMNNMPPARMAEARIIRFWAPEGQAALGLSGLAVAGPNR